jgi:hypothetical protein
MVVKMNIKNKIGLLSVLILSQYSYLNAQKHTIYYPPKYGIWCQDSITALKFESAAMIPFKTTETVLQTNLYLPVLTAINLASSQISQSVNSTVSKSSTEAIQNHNIMQANYNNAIKSLEEENRVIERYIDTKGKQTENLVFNDDRGDLTKRFFQNMCSQSKIVSKAFGSETRNQTANMNNTDTQRSMSENSKITNMSSYQFKKQVERYENFCSQEDMLVGLCETVSAYPNSDLDFNLFFEPTGEITENKEASNFESRYTYNDNEKQIARKYIENVSGFIGIEPPTIKEIENIDTQKFINLYNMYTSANNLSKYSFINSYNSRKALNKDGVKLSKIDSYRFLIYQFGDNITDFQASGGKNSLLAATYIASILNTRLQLDLFSQEERIKLLDAALLNLDKNSPNELEYLESKR